MKRKSIMQFSILILLVGAGIYLFLGLRRPSDYAQATIAIGGTSFRVDIADTIPKQMQGLSGRESLGEREGMLFLFATSSPRVFWMKDMMIPIDLVWLRDETVIGVLEHMQPEPGKNTVQLKLYPSPGFSNRVLEVKDGTVSRLRIKVGDKVVIGNSPD